MRQESEINPTASQQADLSAARDFVDHLVFQYRHDCVLKIVRVNHSLQLEEAGVISFKDNLQESLEHAIEEYKHACMLTDQIHAERKVQAKNLEDVA